MKGRSFYILLFLFQIVAGKGQSYTITGNVRTFQSTGVEAWPVLIATEEGAWPNVHETVYTDSLGFFAFEGQVNDSILLMLTVSTPDCNQQIIDTNFTIGSGQSTEVSLIICNPSPVSCEASFIYNQSPDSSSTDTFQFINTSTGAYTIMLWDFGDGTTSSEFSPIHTFNPGNWNICLTISNMETGCSDTVCQSLFVGSAEPCTNDFSYQVADLQVTFIGWASNSENASFTWEFGDGTTGTGASVSHIYDAGGIYQVNLTTIDSDTCMAFTSQMISITEQQLCDARYQWEVDPSNQMMVHFSDSSIGTIDMWKWTFGDGHISTIQHPDHEYNQAGTYEVCLTIFSEDSLCQSTVCQSVLVDDSVYFPVYGQVLADFFPADEIEVSLFESMGGIPVLADTAYVATQGAFAFYAVPTGSYFLKGSLKSGSSLYNQFLPTYSGNTVLWEEATAFQVNQPTGGADIHLVPKPGATSGNGNIKGLVLREDNIKESDAVIMTGIPVYLFSGQYILVQAVYTASDGSFNFQGVPNGSYYLRPEITGLPVTPFSLTISDTSISPPFIVFSVSPSGIHYGIEEKPIDGISVVGQPYPNPVAEKTSIDIVTTGSMFLNISVADQSGRIVNSQIVALQKGKNIVRLNVSDLPAGFYALMLMNDNNRLIVRKMVKL